jgi:hypothetical protein
MLLGESLYTFLINCYIIQESNIRKIYFGTFIMFEDISQENYSKYKDYTEESYYSKCYDYLDKLIKHFNLRYQGGGTLIFILNKHFKHMFYIANEKIITSEEIEFLKNVNPAYNKISKDENIQFGKLLGYSCPPPYNAPPYNGVYVSINLYAEITPKVDDDFREPSFSKNYLFTFTCFLTKQRIQKCLDLLNEFRQIFSSISVFDYTDEEKESIKNDIGPPDSLPIHNGKLLNVEIKMFVGNKTNVEIFNIDKSALPDESTLPDETTALPITEQELPIIKETKKLLPRCRGVDCPHDKKKDDSMDEKVLMLLKTVNAESKKVESTKKHYDVKPTDYTDYTDYSGADLDDFYKGGKKTKHNKKKTNKTNKNKKKKKNLRKSYRK